MRAIKKGPTPKILLNNSQKWKRMLLEHISNGTRVPESLAKAYNHDEVKTSLADESKGKCMYCESEISHVAHEHIEHFRPKAPTKYPDLAYEWINLGLACPKCNVNKGDDFDEGVPHLNPYIDDLPKFISPHGPLIFPVDCNARGDLTIKSVDLNRLELVERRTERIKSVYLMVEAYKRETNALQKKLWKRHLLEEVAVGTEFSFCTRRFVSEKLGDTFLTSIDDQP